nr:dethiobiotin synthase [Thermosulfurimonas sp.]
MTGTDTGVGKSYATGLLARAYLELGLRVITAKPVQTGATEPEDLLLHRRIMRLPPDPPELLSLTGPYLFSYPAAPATAAKKEGRRVEIARIVEALRRLRATYEVVLVEGAGGLFVPFTEDHTFLDLIQLFLSPVVVVSAARLGTINHTVLTLEALRLRSLVIPALIYNLYFAEDEYLAEESLSDILRIFGPLPVLRMPGFSPENPPVATVREFLTKTPGLRP